MSETLFHLSRKLEQSDIPSPSQKSASVVALFRLSPTSNRFPPSPSSSPDDFFYHLSKLHSNSLELLFIKRALNKKDIHSGQIAFPGGKVEKGESSKQAAIRETLEEIGVDLRSSNFHYLGHTPSENVYKHFRRRTLFVSVHSKSYSVFLFLGDDLSFTLNPKEVSQVFWTDFHLFTHGLLK